MKTLKRSYSKKFLYSILILCLALPLFPLSAHAAITPERYVMVCGQELNETYKYIVNGFRSTIGTLGVNGCTAEYDYNTHTLSLFDLHSSAIFAVSTPTRADLTIDLKGQPSLHSTTFVAKEENGGPIGIRNTNGDITITSEDNISLGISMESENASGDPVCGIRADHITIGGNVNVEIEVRTSFNSGDKSYGLFARDGITIEDDASLKVQAYGQETHGIYAQDEAILLDTFNDITIETYGGVGSDGIRCENSPNYTFLANVGIMRVKGKNINLIIPTIGYIASNVVVDYETVGIYHYYTFQHAIGIQTNTKLEDMSISVWNVWGRYPYQLPLEFDSDQREYILNRSESAITMRLSMKKNVLGQVVTVWANGENIPVSGSGIDIETELIEFTTAVTDLEIRVRSNDGSTTDSYRFTFRKGRDGTIRLSGSNRFGTAVEVSKYGWNQSVGVVLARADDFADSVAGVGLSKIIKAPILLTQTHQLDATTESEIDRLGAQVVIILGGTLAISQQVEDDLIAKGLIVNRIGGRNRYETATMIAQYVVDSARLGEPIDTAIIVYGQNFPDALAAAPLAASLGFPVVMVKTGEIPVETRDFLINNGITKTYAIGGTSVISNAVLNALPHATRIAGNTRYETAVEIANISNADIESVFIASGTSFSDALSLAAFAAQYNENLLLVGKYSIPTSVVSYIQSNKATIDRFFIAGGELVISNQVEQQLGNLLN